MGYINFNNEKLKIGDRVITTREFTSLIGKFTKGTEVTIKDIGDRGYAIEDDEGNYMCEIGWDGLKKIC